MDILAVGDGENDICLLQAAGTSVAFRSSRARVRAAAQFVVDGALTGVLPTVLPEAEPDVLIASRLPSHGEEFAPTGAFSPRRAGLGS
jgi:hypothetical protein